MPTVPRRSKPLIYLALLLLGLPILFCGGLLTWWFGRQGIAASELQRRKAEIQTRGLPVDDQSLTVFRNGLMSHDESDRWMRILTTLESDSYLKATTEVPIVGVAPNEQPFVPGEDWEHAERVEAFLADWVELRREIHEVTEGSGGIWTQINFDSFDTLLPYIQNTRSASRLMKLEHLDAVRRGDHEQGFASLRAMLGVARSLENEPLLIAQLVAIAETSMALEAIKLSVERDLLSEDQLVQLLNELKPLDDFGTGFRLAIAGERAMALPVFENPTRASDVSVPSFLGDRSIDALAALDFYEKAESASSEDLDTFFSEIAQLDQDMEQMLKEAGYLQRIDTILTGLLLPAFKAYAVAVTREAMGQRLTKTAIGVRLFEKRNQQWPSSLGELNSLGVELGSLQPLGPKPFGYQILVDNLAVLWGFDPVNKADQTPDEPYDLSQDNEIDRERLEFWRWNLQPSH